MGWGDPLHSHGQAGVPLPSGWHSDLALTGHHHERARRARAPQSFLYFSRQRCCPAWQAHPKFDLTARALSAFEPACKRPLQLIGKARVHRFERFPAPGAELGISRVDAVIVDEEIIGDVESHGGAAWVGGPSPVKAPPLISARGRVRSRDRVAARAVGHGVAVGSAQKPRMRRRPSSLQSMVS